MIKKKSRSKRELKAAIEAALIPSQYRKYWRAWKGKSNPGESDFDFSQILNMQDEDDLFAWLSEISTKGAYANVVGAVDAYLEEHPEVFLDIPTYKTELYDYLVERFGGNQLNAEIDFEPVYEDLFRGKYRIVIPFSGSEADIVDRYEAKLKENNKGQTFILILRLKIIALVFFSTIHNKEEVDAIRQDITRFRQDGSAIDKQMIKDYLVDGKYRFLTQPKRLYGFGKMIDTIKKKHADLSGFTRVLGKSFEDVVRDFHQRETIRDNKNYIIVISRHPYDIAGMSTDRGWTSCLNIDTGERKHYVMSTIINAGLVAYFCEEDDTNINDPLGRITIKPFIKVGERLDVNNPNWILRCSKSYGMFDPSAIMKTQKWLDQYWNSNIYNSQYKYKLDSTSFYNEEISDEI